MEIEFVIPNGIMHIYADRFFREATRGRIRRMLKLIKKSDPGPELTQGIREWLEGEIRALNEKAERGEDRARKEAAELAGKYQGVLEDVNKILDGGSKS